MTCILEFAQRAFRPHRSFNTLMVRVRVEDGVTVRVRVRGAVPAMTGASGLEKCRFPGALIFDAVQKARGPYTTRTE